MEWGEGSPNPPPANSTLFLFWGLRYFSPMALCSEHCFKGGPVPLRLSQCGASHLPSLQRSLASSVQASLCPCPVVILPDPKPSLYCKKRLAVACAALLRCPSSTQGGTCSPWPGRQLGTERWVKPSVLPRCSIRSWPLAAKAKFVNRRVWSPDARWQPSLECLGSVRSAMNHMVSTWCVPVSSCLSHALEKVLPAGFDNAVCILRHLCLRKLAAFGRLMRSIAKLDSAAASTGRWRRTPFCHYWAPISLAHRPRS